MWKGMKKRCNNSNKYGKLTVLAILLCVMFLSIGYSTHSAKLSVSDIAAMIKSQKDIRITQISLASASTGAVSLSEDNSVNSISSEISLPNSNSTITYYVKVVNIGNIEAAISDISGLPSNLTYSISNYSLNNILCDDNNSSQCKLGSSTTLAITIKYAKDGYDSSNTDYSIEMNFTFCYLTDAIARIDNTLYDTLQGAVAAVPTNNTETTITLLNNTSEIITVSKTKNIVFDLNNKVLSNVDNNPVISNDGTITVSNGTVTSNAPKNAAINNESNGVITINSGEIIATGDRQAFYNNKGIATITGNVYLTSSATERATVQNVSPGTLTITGGTIVSTGMYGIQNASTMTIGVKDDSIDLDSPMIQGVSYGIYSSTNYNFYDGTSKGELLAINQLSRIVDVETGYNVVSSEETIDDTLYSVSYLGIGHQVRFNYNSGTVTETLRYIENGKKIGRLPTTTRSGYNFAGWYTENNGGVEIDSDTIITGTVTFYARWVSGDIVLRIGENEYSSLQTAINSIATDGTPATITLLNNISDNVRTNAGQNIVFDFNGYSLSNSSGTPIIKNYGTIQISDGTILQSATYAAIDVMEDGKLIMTGGTILSTNGKAAIYNQDNGIVDISGNAYLSSNSSGIVEGIERATIQIMSNANSTTITGGTIINTAGLAVSNNGYLTLGIQDDGIISASQPLLIGETNGLSNLNTFNFYDGIIKGKTGTIVGTVTDLESNTHLSGGTELVDGYYVEYLIDDNS